MTSRARLLLVLAALVAATVASASAVPAQAAPRPTDKHEYEHAHTHGPDGLDLDRRGRKKGPAAFVVDDVLRPPWNAADHDGVSPAIATPDSPDVDYVAALPQLHAVYVYPSDAPSRFGQFAAMFQADARQASSFLETKYGRALRWDEVDRGGTRLLDITVIRSAYKANQLATTNQFNLVRADVEQVFPSSTYPHKKFVAWLDSGSQYCGQGELYQDTRRLSGNNNELRTLGIVYRPYAVADATTGGWCRGRTLLHEIGHNLGAVQQVSPRAFDGAHCNDDDNDVMCYTSAATYDSGVAQFDYGTNDYWDPGAQRGSTPFAQKLNWWAVNLNKFVCPTTPTGHANCWEPNAAPGY